MKFHGKIKNCYSSVHIIFHIFMMVQITRIFQAQNSSNGKALKIMTIWTTDFPAVSKDRLHHLKQVGIQNAVLQCLQHNRGHSNCNNICDLFSITQNIKIIYIQRTWYLRIIINIQYMCILFIHSWIWAFTHLMLKIYNDNLLFWSDNSASRVVVFYIFARETNHYALVSLQRSIYRQVTSWRRVRMLTCI